MQKSWLGKQRMLTNIVIMKIVYSVESVCLPDSQRAEQCLSSVVPWSIYALHLPKGLQPGVFRSVQFSHSVVSDTLWTAAHQTSLSITNAQSLLKLMVIKLVMPSNRLILCHPLLLLSIFLSMRVFPVTQLFTSGGQSIGASASVLPMNIQGWFPVGLPGLIFLQY